MKTPRKRILKVPEYEKLDNPYEGKSPREVLKAIWGYDSFRVNQEEAIEDIIRGDTDVFYIASTSSGKTLCFQIPAIIKPGMCLVISPLLSLMQDQTVDTQKIGVRSDTINSLIGVKKKREVMQKIKDKQLDLLYVAPETLLNIEFLDFLQEYGCVSFIVFDEVHSASNASPNFRPKYRRVSTIRAMFDVPVMCLTATADKVTYEDIEKLLKLGTHNKFKYKEYTQNLDRPNITYNVLTKEKDGRDQVVNIIKTYDNSQSGLVYCTTTKQVEETATYLYKQGIKAKAFHSKIKAKDKPKILEEWLTGKIQVVVATSAFGTGINKPDTRFVIIMNMPYSMEDYSQFTGRCGRDGLPAQSYLLYDFKDYKLVQWILKQSTTNPNTLQKDLAKLNDLKMFLTSTDCYRARLLEYFGQKYDGYRNPLLKAARNCAGCSNCSVAVNL